MFKEKSNNICENCVHTSVCKYSDTYNLYMTKMESIVEDHRNVFTARLSCSNYSMKDDIRNIHK